jgi:hypothetical protein
MKKSNTVKAPLQIEISAKDVRRIEKILRGDETPTSWCMAVLRDVLESEEEDCRMNRKRVSVTLPQKTVARLERAAAFEEMTVPAYLKDGIRRDLDLSDDLMASPN